MTESHNDTRKTLNRAHLSKADGSRFQVEKPRSITAINNDDNVSTNPRPDIASRVKLRWSAGKALNRERDDMNHLCAGTTMC